MKYSQLYNESNNRIPYTYNTSQISCSFDKFDINYNLLLFRLRNMYIIRFPSLMMPLVLYKHSIITYVFIILFSIAKRELGLTLKYVMKVLSSKGLLHE